jgi:hypothetical protein
MLDLDALKFIFRIRRRGVVSDVDTLPIAGVLAE